MTRFVFLDVDGPLNNYETSVMTHTNIVDSYVSPEAVWEVCGGIIYLICPWMLNNLYDVLRAYDDVKLIGISSWFNGGNVDCVGSHMFTRVTGLKLDGVIDYTGGGSYRFTCAEEYAVKHGVDKYVIIDDLQYDHEKLVKIHREGLSKEKADEAIRMMK
ncbi:hypothetical protein ASwh1_54 [Aeromonas phage Aswh_1]|nr:hypothetical protein ASwh1_54 [Aeromonas phage Aswh_1]